jgi:LPS-assembly lipoprotein
MPSRRAFAGLLMLGLPLGLPLGLAGCGWTPLYADAVAGPADEELRAIRVAPISERLGQRLAMALRESLNPRSIQTPQRYLLRVTLQVVRIDLGVQTQGLGTRGRVDVYATYYLTDSKTNVQLSSGVSHVAESFDIIANQYSNTVAEEDARIRAVEELRRDIVSRLTVVMHYRVAERPK